MAAARVIGAAPRLATVVNADDPTPPTGSGSTVVGTSLIDEIVQGGARRMLAAALEAEVTADVAEHADQLDEAGRRLVVRNGHATPRQVLTSAGAVQVAAPRVNDKRVDEATGGRQRFASAILPPDAASLRRSARCCRCRTCTASSSQDFVPSLEQFLGTGAGMSAATVTWLTSRWQDEARAFANRDLSAVGYVYVWADGVPLNVRLEEAKLCLLVLIGCGSTAARNSSPWPRVTASRPGRGPICCATTPGAACAPRSSRSATARSASRRRCARSSRTPGCLSCEMPLDISQRQPSRFEFLRTG
jgi:hypothetical protein